MLKATHINVKGKKNRKKRQDKKTNLPKLNRKIVETCKVDIPNIHVHDLRLSLSIQSGGVTSEATRLCTCFPYVSLIPTLTYNWMSNVVIINALILNFMHNIFYFYLIFVTQKLSYVRKRANYLSHHLDIRSYI